MLRDRRGQWAIIEILVVAVIIIVAAYFILPGYLSGGKNAKGEADKVHTPIGQAQSVDCRNNLNQIRNAITVKTSSGEDTSFPSSLADMEPIGISGAVTKCPISGKEYTYDGSTGKVSCTTSGHEGY